MKRATRIISFFVVSFPRKKLILCSGIPRPAENSDLGQISRLAIIGADRNLILIGEATRLDTILTPSKGMRPVVTFTWPRAVLSIAVSGFLGATL